MEASLIWWTSSSTSPLRSYPLRLHPSHSTPPPSLLLTPRSLPFAFHGCRCTAAATHRISPHRRSEFTWTRSMSEKVKSGDCREAINMYREMREAGMTGNTYTFVAVLKACCSLRELRTGREIHGHVIESGCELQMYVATGLVEMYAKCGSMKEAEEVFERMSRQSVIVWNIMILGHAQREEGELALQLFARMQREAVAPDDRTFVAALKACASLAAQETSKGVDDRIVRSKFLKLGRTIHSHVAETVFLSDKFVGTTLVDMYSKCRSMEDSGKVFDSMPDRCAPAWNAMILGYAQAEQGQVALQLYTDMLRGGIPPDSRTFTAALKACSSLAAQETAIELDGKQVKAGSLKRGRSIHAEAAERGFCSQPFVATTLVDMYAKCGSMDDACQIFDMIPSPNVVAWNALILGYAQLEEGDKALRLFDRMEQEGFAPDARTFVGAVKACTSMAAEEEGKGVGGKLVKLRSLMKGKCIHSKAAQRGFASDIFVATTLIDMYAKCGSMEDARQIFDRMPVRNVVSWAAMILGYAHMEEGELALQLFTAMQDEGIPPDPRTLVGALKACGSLATQEEEAKEVDGKVVKLGSLRRGKIIHSEAAKRGFSSDMFVATTLVDMYAKCGSMEDARHVFDTMPLHDVVSWTAMILGYAQRDEGDLALNLYARMQHEGITPNARTFVGVLKACGSMAVLETGKSVHAEICRLGLEGDAIVASSLIDMYGKCGSMGDAQRLFDTMCIKDLVAWNTLIAGYSRQGDSDRVFSLFHNMRNESVEPDKFTFLSILNVCSHMGLVDEGHKFFESMSIDHRITPTIDHYNCMVDLLARAGRLNQALTLVKEMPFRPNMSTWSIVLGACRKWNNVEAGKAAFEFAVRSDDTHSAAFVLMSNIYASTDICEESSSLRKQGVL